MKRMLHGSVAKRPSYDTVQFKCGKCGREITLLGKSEARPHLRTPKCSNVVMEQVHYAENISTPSDKLTDQLRASGKPWLNVHTVKGDPQKHKERDTGQSPELADRGYAYSSPFLDDDAKDREDRERVRQRREAIASTADHMMAIYTNEQTRQSVTAARERINGRTVESGPLREGETLADALARTMREGTRILRSGR